MRMPAVPGSPGIPFQLKDFLTLYNKVTELCFSRCVDNLNERDLASHEVSIPCLAPVLGI